MQKILNYIGGKLIEPVGGQFIDNYDPSRGEVYSLIPDSDERDVQLAVDAAMEAKAQWAAMTAQQRGDILNKVAGLIEMQLDHFAHAESLDNGKPVKLAESVDIPRAVSNLRFFAGAVQYTSSDSHHMEGMGLNYTLRHPIGIAGCISPWNLPLYLFTWKIAPALATGNCVVAKPSEVTPMTAYMLSQACIDAGMPAGVLNIVHGLGPKVGQAIVEHKGIPAISFTGGTATGERIAATAAPMFKKLSLELGGKNPNIIFDDCDFSKMLSTTMRSSFANQGQICLCGSRILVHKTIYERFKSEFVAKTEATKVSFPTDPEAKLGALVSKDHMEKVLAMVERAKEEGGRVLTGGERVRLEGEYSEGYYVRPTIIEGLDHMCLTNQEEIFGPVVTLIPFETEEEAIEMANSVKYGLSSTVWTNDLTKAHRVASKLHTGIVWVNSWLVRDLRTPFGGMKASGVGREGGNEALRFFTEPKNVFIPY